MMNFVMWVIKLIVRWSLLSFTHSFLGSPWKKDLMFIKAVIFLNYILRNLNQRLKEKVKYFMCVDEWRNSQRTKWNWKLYFQLNFVLTNVQWWQWIKENEKQKSNYLTTLSINNQDTQWKGWLQVPRNCKSNKRR